MTTTDLYERVLGQQAAEGRRPELAPPRASAAVVPWRWNERGKLEVYWIKRSAQVPFMAGWHAFAGGGLSRLDSQIQVRGLPQGMESQGVDYLPDYLRHNLDGLDPDLLPGLIACALRELFEETGLLLTDGLRSHSRTDLEQVRARLLNRELPFQAALNGLGVALEAHRLVYAGRWITPPLAPIRFDNRFFLLNWPAQESYQPSVIPGELEHGEWIEPDAAYRRWLQGQVLAAPPILHVLQVLHEDGPEGGLERLRRPLEAELGSFRRVEFRPGVLLFPLATPTLPPATHTNCYLIGTHDAVLIDPGTPFEDELVRLEGALEAVQGKLGRRIVGIWLTHHHPDHVGGVERLRRALGIPVVAHPRTADRLSERGIPCDELLVEGQDIVLPGDPPFPVRVLHTPGHTRGHLAFWLGAHDSLVAGDMASTLSTIVIDPPEGDMSAYTASLQRLADLEPRALFPAHGPVIHDGAARLRQLAEHRRWREARILESWCRGLRTSSDILPEVYDDLPKQAHPLAERQIEAHLQRLRALGQID